MQITAESIIKNRSELCGDVVSDTELRTKIIRLSILVISGGAIYGFMMGLRHSFWQAVASAIKVPGLFFVTLLICLPTLHYIGLLFGSKINLKQTLTILLTGTAVNSILLASFAPIAFFFLISGSQYGFLLLMHVVVFIICGAAGLVMVHRNFHTIRRLVQPETKRNSDLLAIWMFLYMFVGSQMAYIMAPFVGRESEFMLFRAPQDNFYTYIWRIILDLMQ